MNPRAGGPVLEVARIDIVDGYNAAFEAAMNRALGLLERSRGFRAARLFRSHEVPNRYRLLVEWDSIENHTVDWKDSPSFQAWRSLLAQHFASIPAVEHMQLVTDRITATGGIYRGESR